jgi:hypothetical protein
MGGMPQTMHLTSGLLCNTMPVQLPLLLFNKAALALTEMCVAFLLLWGFLEAANACATGITCTATAAATALISDKLLPIMKQSMADNTLWNTCVDALQVCASAASI